MWYSSRSGIQYIRILKAYIVLYYTHVYRIPISEYLYLCCLDSRFFWLQWCSALCARVWRCCCRNAFARRCTNASRRPCSESSCVPSRPSSLTTRSKFASFLFAPLSLLPTQSHASDVLHCTLLFLYYTPALRAVRTGRARRRSVWPITPRTSTWLCSARTTCTPWCAPTLTLLPSFFFSSHSPSLYSFPSAQILHSCRSARSRAASSACARSFWALATSIFGSSAPQLRTVRTSSSCTSFSCSCFFLCSLNCHYILVVFNQVHYHSVHCHYCRHFELHVHLHNLWLELRLL